MLRTGSRAENGKKVRGCSGSQMLAGHSFRGWRDPRRMSDKFSWQRQVALGLELAILMVFDVKAFPCRLCPNSGIWTQRSTGCGLALCLLWLLWWSPVQPAVSGPLKLTYSGFQLV